MFIKTCVCIALVGLSFQIYMYVKIVIGYGLRKFDVNFVMGNILIEIVGKSVYSWFLSQ